MPIHFVLCPFGTGGDVLPLIGIGRQLVAAGHHVTVVSMDNFQAAAEDAGLRFESFGSSKDYDDLGSNPKLWKPFVATRLVIDLALQASQHSFAAIERVIARHPGQQAILVAPGTNFGARLAREALRLPLVTAHLQPISMLSGYDFPILHLSLAWMADIPLWLRKTLIRLPNGLNLSAQRPLRSLCQAQGIKPPARLIPDWWHSPDANLALFPSWFASPRPDWPANTYQHHFPLEDLAQDKPMAPELANFLSTSREKPIVFTAGTGNQHAKDFFHHAAEAALRLDRTAILATRHVPDLPTQLPATITTSTYVPFSQILPDCAAIVHHGGIGTVSQAIAAGIPQLIIPLAHDQPDNAIRVRQKRFGYYLPRHRLSTDTLTHALEELLKNRVTVAPLEDTSEMMGEKINPEPMIRWLEAVKMAA